jgi:hypothetical protein
LANHYQVPTWQPSSKLGCQVQTWQSLLSELVESIPSQKTWAAKYELGKNLPSCNLAAKLEFGTWHELGKLGTNLAVIKYHASGISITTTVCFTTVDIIIWARCSWPAQYLIR